ncbi:MAG: DUF924 family protein [Pseudomonadota bacterium]|nr:DUF924 family protein [Pseudomonadota bacterium]
MLPRDIIDFWFSEESRVRWFDSTPEYDQVIKTRFELCWRQARDAALAGWERTAEGALALVILLDQMPLNMFRDQPKSFSTEAQSREVAGRAIDHGLDAELSIEQKVFLYMPYMHSESLADQAHGIYLFEKAGLDENAKWAGHHLDIVRRFGRFPHRNAILGRESTPEELEWLASADGFNP